MTKKPNSSGSYAFLYTGSKLVIKFVSPDGIEIFLFDSNRAGIKVTKVLTING